jgi:hypothetical protein
MASDCTSGSSSVKISGQEVMLKNKSYFKRSMGDEAGCAPKKGVVTSKNMGKVYFTMWSMDVKVEGENVVRMMDLTTHNHASQGPNSPPMVYFDQVAIALPEICRDEADRANAACKDSPTPPVKRPRRTTAKGNLVDDGLDCSEECKKRQKCILVPKEKDSQACCAPDITGDHLIEVGCFTQSGGRGGAPGVPKQEVLDAFEATHNTKVILATPKSHPRRLEDFRDYDDKKAPTACAGPQRKGFPHYEMQNYRDRAKRQFRSGNRGGGLQHTWVGGEKSYWTYGEAAQVAVESHQKAFSQHRCDPDCMRAQLDAYHHDVLPGRTAAEKNDFPVRTRIRKRR